MWEQLVLNLPKQNQGQIPRRIHRETVSSIEITETVYLGVRYALLLKRFWQASDLPSVLPSDGLPRSRISQNAISA